MFSRRTPLNHRQRLREAFWPKMGIQRVAAYYGYRLGRLPGSPASIAGGAAFGVAVSFTPFIGLHLLIGIFVCHITRMSKIAMALATVVAGNPWTFPFIWIGSYEVGRAVLQAAGFHLREIDVLEKLSFQYVKDNPYDLLLPMLVGSVPFAVFFGTAVFFGVRKLVGEYKNARLEKIRGGSA